jgi:predicted ABC-type exoprotein transport system permease subunit
VDKTVGTITKTKLIVITLVVAFLVADLFWSMQQHAFNQWLALFIYVVVLVILNFFVSKWISKQPDQLKARYRATNISMWIFLLLATVSIVPNFFISGEIDKTMLWPAGIISMSLMVSAFYQRQDLLRQLAERDKAVSI